MWMAYALWCWRRLLAHSSVLICDGVSGTFQERGNNIACRSAREALIERERLRVIPLASSFIKRKWRGQIPCDSRPKLCRRSPGLHQAHRATGIGNSV